jgi:prefoldin alpha subunit
MSKPNESTPAGEEVQEKHLNELVAEIQILESYYNQIVSNMQTATAALSEIGSTIQSIDGLARNVNADLLIPIGGGLWLPVSGQDSKKLVLSVGAGVAIEKDFDSAKVFLQAREKEYEKAKNTLEQNSKEIGSRLEIAKNLVQQVNAQR